MNTNVQKTLLLSAFISIIQIAYTQNDPCGCSNLLKVKTIEEITRSSNEHAKSDLLKYYLSFNYSEVRNNKDKSWSFLIPKYFDANNMRNESSFKQKQSELKKVYKLSAESITEDILVKRYQNRDIGKDFNECLKNCNEMNFVSTFYEDLGSDNYRINIRSNLPGNTRYKVVSSNIGNAEVLTGYESALMPSEFIPKGFSNSTGIFSVLVKRTNPTLELSYSLTVTISGNTYSMSHVIAKEQTEYVKTYRKEFRNGESDIKYDPGYPGNISIDEIDGAVQFITDNNAIGTGTYIMPLKVPQRTKKLQLSFPDIILARSSSKGNTTLLQIYLSSSGEFNDQDVLAGKKFETTDSEPLTAIPYFTLEADVENYNDRNIYLIIIVRDAWKKYRFTLTIPKFNMIQIEK